MNKTLEEVSQLFSYSMLTLTPDYSIA